MNLDLLRSFFETVRLGSLSKAAEQLRLSQSTLTRQMSTLEHEVGGPLLERGPAGVELTALGHALRDGMRPVMAQYDAVMTDIRKRARGQNVGLRVGYLLSASPDHFTPVFARFRRDHPEVKIRLEDLSPGEQMEALRKGTIDIALSGHAGDVVYRDAYVRRIATIPVVIALAETHRLAPAASIRIRDLAGEAFIGARDEDLPGYNRWITQLCRRAKFRPRFVEYGESLTHSLSSVVTEGAVGILPAFSAKATVPGVVFRPLAEKGATWDLVVAWPRGKLSPASRALIDAFFPTKT
ncbi:MAG TPA: LysR family transcriptional regulator [Opitutaceae bacterium]